MSLDASLIERLPDEFPQTRRILIAFSGGLDSRVLLHLAASVRERLTAALRAVHIDHGLQAESGQWAEACRTLCRRLAIPLDVLEANLRPEKGQSVEAEARQHRYALFESLLLPGDLLLLAQHADDQAETVLLQLLRGAGPAGLAAMPRTRRLGAGLLVRPLLDVPRAALEDFARHKGLDWIDDPSNRQHRFDRNYLRHEILPLLEKRFPAYRQTLARSAAHCAESAGMLDELIARDLADCLDARDNSLQLEKLRDLPQTRWKSVIRAWIGANSCRMPQTRQLEQIVRDFLLNLTASAGQVGTSEYEIRRYRQALYLLPKSPPPRAFRYIWPDPALPLRLAELDLTLDQSFIRDAGIVLPDNSPLTISSRAGGEKIRQGNPPRHRSLKKLFQERAVPPWQRDRLPLIYHQGRLIAVPGIAVDPDYAQAHLNRDGLSAAT